MSTSGVLGFRLPATYLREYVSVAGISAALLDGHFEPPERDACVLSESKRRLP
jgi:hypothetical protein